MTAVALAPVLDILVEPKKPGDVELGDLIANAQQLKACLDGEISFDGVCVARVWDIETKDGAFHFWCDDVHGPNVRHKDVEDEVWDEEVGDFVDVPGAPTGHAIHIVPFASVAPILHFRTPEGAGQS